MKRVTIADNVYSVGVADWNIRHFHGYTYTTGRGSSYNAFLVMDKKIALIDTVYGPFAQELIEHIKEIVDPSKIEYVVANHVETDHSGALPEIMKLCPNATVIGTAKCKEGLSKYYPNNWKFQVVKTGDTVSLGTKTLSFIEAPMIHWPDSMWTYIPQDELLLSNDAFGQHIASTERFDDETDNCILMDEAAKYYANILIPFSSMIAKKIAEVAASGIKIKTIAPAHGIVWRKNPVQIMEAYASWSKGLPLKNDVLVCYETMWNATENIAKAIVDGLTEAGVEARLYNVAVSDRTEILKDVLNCKGVILGSSTHDNNMLPTMAALVDFIKGLKIKNRFGAAFGAYGWSGESVKHLDAALTESGIGIIAAPLSIKWRASDEEIKACVEYGRAFAEALKAK
jgi:anaerobic nitric oxide reductase flavorubredoxin